MYGVESVNPILNPPQSCILGIGAGQQRPVVRDGKLAVGTAMTCTLSADHRAVDGAAGAELLAAFKKRIEDPLRMLL
jgi:pyruvate dehydrogenase E2 component (dihydrolipoamide acetyltransferase)